MTADTKPDSKPAAAAMPRLTGFRIRPDAALPPPLHQVGYVDVARPVGPLQGWSISVRGAVAFLISPRGWKQGKPSTEWSPKGKVTLFGPIPIANITLIWEGDPEAVDKLQRYDSAPMTIAAPQADEQMAIDAKELGDP